MSGGDRVLFAELGEPAVEVRFEGATPVVVSVNRMFEETFGLREEQIRGDSLNDHIVSADEQESARKMDQTGATGAVVEQEIRRQTPDGPRWFLFRSVPFTKDGTQCGYAIYVDITERKRQRRRFEELIRKSSDIITVLDPDGVYRYQSPSAEATLGHDPEAIVGENAFDFIHPEDRERVMGAFADAVTEPAATPTVQYRFEHADGSWVWLESVGNNQLDNPAVEGFIVNSRDITPRVEYEQELQLLKQVSTRVFRHNVRNRLNVIESHAELLADRAESDVEESVKAIFEETSRLLDHSHKVQLIADVIDEQTTRTVDLAACVSRAVEPVRAEHPAASIDVDVSPVPVQVHRTFVDAIQELVENGLQHAPERRDPRVSIRTRADTEADVAVLVEDNAGGLPEEEVAVLEASEESSLEHGSGVGLWLVQWVVDRSDGELSIERTDRGSRFTIELHAAAEDIHASTSAPD